MKKLSMLDDDMPEDEATVVSMYEKVLDHLLTPAQVKEQLMQSQSTEKKWKTILMHKKLFDGEHATKSGAYTFASIEQYRMLPIRCVDHDHLLPSCLTLTPSAQP